MSADNITQSLDDRASYADGMGHAYSDAMFRAAGMGNMPLAFIMGELTRDAYGEARRLYLDAGRGGHAARCDATRREVEAHITRWRANA